MSTIAIAIFGRAITIQRALKKRSHVRAITKWGAKEKISQYWNNKHFDRAAKLISYLGAPLIFWLTLCLNLKTVAIKKKTLDYYTYIDQSLDVSSVDWFVWSDYALLIDRTERHAFESRLLCCCEKTVCSSF